MEIPINICGQEATSICLIDGMRVCEEHTAPDVYRNVPPYLTRNDYKRISDLNMGCEMNLSLIQNCPVCDGLGVFFGTTLGNLNHYTCQDCGIGFNLYNYFPVEFKIEFNIK